MANPNHTSERRHLAVWRRLRDRFRNLSNPKKVASVAGGVATTLAIITGLITVGEKINSAMGAGGDAEEHPIRVDFQYYGEYNEGVAIGGFDPEHDPVSQLKEDPSYWQLGGERVAFSYPRVWADVTSLAKNETVTLSPYLVVELTDIRPMPERVNYVVSTRGGNAGIIRHFAVTLSPDRKRELNTPPMPQGEKIDSAMGAGGGAKTKVNIRPMPQYDRREVQKAIETQQEAVREYAYPYTPPEQLKAPGEDAGGERIVFYAPQYTSETAALEGWPPSNEKVYPFFTLAPGRKEVLLLSVTMLPEYFYHFRVGVQYSYKGRQGVVWSEEFVAAVPLEAEVWVQTEGSSSLRKFGDLQEFEDCILTEDGVRITPTHSILCS